MKTHQKISTVVGLGVILFCLWPLTGVRADTLDIPGTGACEVLLRTVAEAFNARHPQHRVMVPFSIGSVGAMRVITSDQAVLVRVARPLTQKEKEQGLTYLPFARDMVVFAVGAKVPIRQITSAELVEVYSGKIKTWEALGGPNVPIRLLLRQPGDSSLRIIQKHLKAFRTIVFDPSGKIPYTDPDMLTLLQKYNYAIGWLTFSALKGAKTPLYPLALDGIPPTPENALTKKYKLLEEYALVFKENRLTSLARMFLDFLFSPQGQRVIASLGSIALPRK
ncbi:MAG: PstS family phosphate ABC transporter substrate-binding protein [Thermodesulfobacteriota bacterium]